MGVAVEKLEWRDIPLDAIDLPKRKLELTLGLGSGLTSHGGRVFAVTDRGPNLFISQAVDDYGLDFLKQLHTERDAKIMPHPHDGPEIAELRIEGNKVKLVRRMPLRTPSGRRLSGVAMPGSKMEPVFDLQGRPLAADALGADSEAIAVMPDGSFFVGEEYGPSVLKVDANGVVTERWVPEGSEKAYAHADILVSGVLPERAIERRRNRGFEALCASEDGRHLYLGFQSALKGEDEHSTPIWKLHAHTGKFVEEYLYPFDGLSSFRRDAARRKLKKDDLKICEIAWAGKDRLVVLERVSHTAKLYAVDLTRPTEKRLLVSSDDHPEIGPDMEGMTLLSDREILMCSDNDFSVEGAVTEFWRIGLDAPLGD